MHTCFQDLFNRTKIFLKEHFLAVVFFVVILAFWVILLYQKYINFGYYDWDYGLYAQVMESILVGNLSPSLFGFNFLGNHMNLIAFVITPIYALFHHPFTLIILKVLSFNLAGFIIYLIAAEKLNKPLGLGLMVLYGFAPANVFMLFHEFDFENIAAVLVCLMFYSFLKKRLILFFIFSLLLLMVKENMPLVVLCMGFYALIFKKEKRFLWSLPLILVSAVYFYLVMMVIIPDIKKDFVVNQSTYVVVLYGDFGNSIGEAFKNIILQPAKVINLLLQQKNLNYYFDLWGHWHILPWLGLPALLLIAPILLQNSISAVFQMHTILFQYNSVIIPIIFISAIYGLVFLKLRLRRSFFIFVLGLTLMTQGMHIQRFMPQVKEKIVGWKDNYDGIRQGLLAQIPKNAGVITTFPYLSHLPDRKYLHPFYYVLINKNVFTHKTPFVIGPEVRYALLDLEDPWVLSLRKRQNQTVPYIAQAMLNENWFVKQAMGSEVLLDRQETTLGKLVERLDSNQAPDQLSALNLSIDEQLLLETIKVNVSGVPYFIHFMTDWKALSKTTDEFAVKYFLLRNNQISYHDFHRIGYTIYTTDQWLSGERIREQYWMRLPVGMESGEYQIGLAIIKDGQKDLLAISRLGNSLEAQQSIILGTFKFEKQSYE